MIIVHGSNDLLCANGFMYAHRFLTNQIKASLSGGGNEC